MNLQFERSVARAPTDQTLAWDWLGDNTTEFSESKNYLELDSYLNISKWDNKPITSARRPESSDECSLRSFTTVQLDASAV